MDRARIRRVIIGVFMESPFYFTLPVRQRLELIHTLTQSSAYHRLNAVHDSPPRGEAEIELKKHKVK